MSDLSDWDKLVLKLCRVNYNEIPPDQHSQISEFITNDWHIFSALTTKKIHSFKKFGALESIETGFKNISGLLSNLGLQGNLIIYLSLSFTIK